MLPRLNRVLTGAEFRKAFQSPVRVHTNWASLYFSSLDSESSTKVGFVVSKQVGNAVQRNRAKRRLRSLSRNLILNHPTGAMIVFRVRPEIHTFSHEALETEFSDALSRLLIKSKSPINQSRS